MQQVQTASPVLTLPLTISGEEYGYRLDLDTKARCKPTQFWLAGVIEGTGGRLPLQVDVQDGEVAIAMSETAIQQALEAMQGRASAAEAEALEEQLGVLRPEIEAHCLEVSAWLKTT